jgi:prophage antirepressor-like protein
MAESFTPTTITAVFNGNPVTIIERDGQRWLTAQEIGLALGYNPDTARTGITNLYGRHADEFNAQDTCAIKLMANSRGNPTARIFSATGCIKLGFFASTVKAKAFRAWASEVLAGQAEAPSASAELAQLRGQVAQLQSAALHGNPRWAALVRYRAAGLTRAECAKLLGCSVCTVGDTIRHMRGMGLDVAAAVSHRPAAALQTPAMAQPGLFEAA